MYFIFFISQNEQDESEVWRTETGLSGTRDENRQLDQIL
jgi:hypothetical protein